MVYMAVYGCIWLCMAVHGCIWLHVAAYGSLQRQSARKIKANADANQLDNQREKIKGNAGANQLAIQRVPNLTLSVPQLAKV